MDFLLAQGITETIEIQTKPEEPTGGGATEEIEVQTNDENIKRFLESINGEKQEEHSPPPNVIKIPSHGGPPTFGPPIVAPIRGLPMGTIIETITVPASVPTPTPPKSTTPPAPQRKMTIQGVTEEFKQEPSGQITIKREICDGEVNLGPFKSCLKEFTGVPAVGWVAAAAGLIVLWKWLDYRFKK